MLLKKIWELKLSLAITNVRERLEQRKEWGMS